MIATLLTSLALVAAAPAPDNAFMDDLQALCGKAYAGRVVTSDPADTTFAERELVMHVRDCSASEVRIPFRVGEDRSRTWVITRTPDGLRLKHDHRHADGAEDVLSQYGGEASTAGSAGRQEFPADAFSKDLFQKHGNPASVTNVWAVEVHPGRTFAYELRRPNRHFRVEFDLSRPLPQP
jgi:hypothetical protein